MPDRRARRPATRPARGGPPRGRARRTDAARLAAYDVLHAVTGRGAYANLLLPSILDERKITGRDAALATELAYGTLRGRGTYDAILATCSDRPVGELDDPVREVLRLGTHQLLATRVGSHAAVSTSVDLAKDVAGPRVSGFVNAVLRRVATRDLEQWLAILAPGSGHQDLAVRYSYPQWIVDAFADALGADPAQALAAGNDRPRVTLAVLPGTDRETVMPAGAEPTAWSPYGFILPGGDPRGVLGDPRAGVQDEASQLAALALARVRVEGSESRWLDLCAGPGGKARLLASLGAGRGIRFAASEIRQHRARLVRDALNIPEAVSAVVTADGRRAPFPASAFDRVLADVPCTGLGALRRRPEARWRKSPQDLPGLTQTQRELLHSAIDLTRAGGVTAYVTCSPHLAETRDVVLDVTAARDDVEIMDAPASMPEVPDLAAMDPRFAQFWPHRHGTDAIFIALLRKR
jgi:16S rRNA (cytosine967-C5)-methyltransferase